MGRPWLNMNFYGLKGVLRGLKWFIRQIAFKESRFRNAFSEFPFKYAFLKSSCIPGPFDPPDDPYPKPSKCFAPFS